MVLSRDQKFLLSFSDFMRNLTIDNMIFNLNYELINRTENKTRCVHRYDLHILGTREDEYSNNENVINILPRTNAFINKLKQYYDPYKLLQNGRNCSYIKILSEPDNEEITHVAFKIIYHKQHLPFPVRLSTIDAYKREIENLEFLLQEENIRKEILEKKITKYESKIKSTQKTIKKLYVENMNLKNEKEKRCPVCWETIEVDQLEIPVCLHEICKDCFKKIKKCPLCREKYIKVR